MMRMVALGLMAAGAVMMSCAAKAQAYPPYYTPPYYGGYHWGPYTPIGDYQTPVPCSPGDGLYQEAACSSVPMTYRRQVAPPAPPVHGPTPPIGNSINVQV